MSGIGLNDQCINIFNYIKTKSQVCLFVQQPGSLNFSCKAQVEREDLEPTDEQIMLHMGCICMLYMHAVELTCKHAKHQRRPLWHQSIKRYSNHACFLCLHSTSGSHSRSMMGAVKWLWTTLAHQTPTTSSSVLHYQSHNAATEVRHAEACWAVCMLQLGRLLCVHAHVEVCTYCMSAPSSFPNLRYSS